MIDAVQPKFALGKKERLQDGKQQQLGAGRW